MTRYGFAIKALPQGGKPFGEEDDDENEETAGTEEASLETAGPGVSSEPPGNLEEELPENPAAAPAAPGEDPAAPETSAEPPAPDAPPEEGGAEEDPGAAPAPPEDDSRPWAGDEYNEGDETDPEGPESWCAYTGSAGEQAWLDQAPDGTLTGWVRDGDGQVWRYTDPDAWATDVDGAQMTQTHHNGEDRTAGQAAPGDAAPPGDRGVQDSMFASQ
ncbi:hypothetical protein ACIP93_33270 [Streptomyces sp. NPDC088745]|uniref:hypothetical protein n=1 Tax=Streptomyces sp. NPDC088745 TaxID=3365884 RepID=UPI0038025696